MSNKSEVDSAVPSDKGKAPAWLDVECATCGAKRGERCGRYRFGVPWAWERTKPHAQRLKDTPVFKLLPDVRALFPRDEQMKYLITTIIAVCALTACSREADLASHNLSVAADQFEVTRRIVFYNGITGEYMLTIQGLCSLGNQDSHGQLSVTCKIGPAIYKKHFLGLSNNVTYFVEQIDGSPASPYQYRVIFKPLSIVPDIEAHK